MESISLFLRGEDMIILSIMWLVIGITMIFQYKRKKTPILLLDMSFILLSYLLLFEVIALIEEDPYRLFFFLPLLLFLILFYQFKWKKMVEEVS
jgi:Ca2+/Na+ antiporter